MSREAPTPLGWVQETSTRQAPTPLGWVNETVSEDAPTFNPAWARNSNVVLQPFAGG